MTFDRNVWDICRNIPKGRVTTYKDIAKALQTKAYRAVGNALNRNPYWPEVPCHRVICSDGKVGGFARGSNAKAKLLKDEGIIIRHGTIDLDHYGYKPRSRKSEQKVYISNKP